MGRKEPVRKSVFISWDVSEKVYPMVPSGAANTEMIGGEVYADALV